MNDINWLHAIHYYCDRLLELWPGKVALGTALAAVLTALGIDHVLFGVLLASVMGEMLTRIIVHCKRGKSLCRGLHHGLVRYSCYFFFLLMAVGVDISLRRALGFALPVTDVFMAYLVLTDCASIIGHLVWLGVPVPPLLVVLVTGGRTRLEKTVEDAVEGRRARTKRNKKSWAAMMAWPASTVWNAVTCIADANCKKSADRCRRDLNPDTGPLLQGGRALPAYAYSSSQRKKCSANTNRGNPLTAAAETRTRIPPLPLRGEVHVVDSYAH